ncbi:MAG: hypothetical protein ACREIS_13195 [Nitrospiraceae bacterium]
MANASAVGRSAQGPIPVLAMSPFYGWLPRSLWRKVKDFFVYSSDFIPLAAGGTATQDIAVQADSDFVIIAGVRVYTTTGDVAIAGDFFPALVTIRDSGSGRQLMDRPVHAQNLFGTAQLPAYWPFPKLIRASSTVSTTLQNLEATARNIRISYWGFKVFPVLAEE